MQDYLLDDNGDLLIENGDFVIGNSELQHQQDLLASHKGEWKEYPEIGVGISEELLNENPRQVLVQIRANFEYDGMRVKTLGIAPNGNLVIDATYK
ncbi:hypothetical protein BFP77_08310 [Maribacter sp. 4U21]|uniref:oxidase n=1 Tax=Maribacter sp. 4U21 TaxID=1889779 RepID=UPI000C150C0F|nr:oxidase [Maribacter sp. 4U21]PIB28910.1 hypothetical protein BFP77_08310 [Maribacter sp. 4U21]